MANDRRPNVKHRDRAASEARLLAAAEECFAKYGFNGTTTKLLAKKAGVNEALIARYFDGKSGLLFSLIQKHLEQEGTAVLSYPSQKTPDLEMFEYASTQLHQALSQPEFFKIVISQALTDPKFLKRLKDTMPLDKHNSELTKRLEALKKNKKIASDISISKVIEDISIFETGVSFFEGILMQESTEACIERLRHFIKIYMRGCKD